MSEHIRKILRKTEEGIKGYLTPGALFEEFGLRYIGPINGHNMAELLYTFKAVKEMDTPVLVHVYTHKGKRSKSAEKDAIKYYSVEGLNNQNNDSDAISYSKAFGHSVTQLAKNENKIL